MAPAALAASLTSPTSNSLAVGVVDTSAVEVKVGLGGACQCGVTWCPHSMTEAFPLPTPTYTRVTHTYTHNTPLLLWPCGSTPSPLHFSSFMASDTLSFVDVRFIAYNKHPDNNTHIPKHTHTHGDTPP